MAVAMQLLQLLVYCEILPNVCHMLDYNPARIRFSVVLGSLIPLGLLTGWAALGVALVPASVAATTDPVRILLQGGGAIPQRLLVLSLSAIGTTILGSYLALESAFKDVTSMVMSWQQKRLTARPDMTSWSFWQQSWVSNLCITLPPTLIAAISPSVFLQAIDFAGSYPILLLYGMIPPLMALKLRVANGKNRWKYVAMAITSGAMVTASFLTDLKWMFDWMVSAVF